jgi:hypothetical protein
MQGFWGVAERGLFLAAVGCIGRIRLRDKILGVPLRANEEPLVGLWSRWFWV